MSCPCQDTQPIVFTAPVTTGTPLKDCPAGERCDEVTDAACVQYNDDPVVALGIKKGDRLHTILKNLALNVGSQAIKVKISKSISFSGSGLNSDPLTGEVILDPDPENLVKASDKGLVAKVDVAMVTRLLTLVKTIPALQTLFCEIGLKCDFGCGSVAKPSTKITP